MAKILVIEDNPTNLQLMVYLLQAFGYTPLEAADGGTGLDLVRREAPNLILCDIQLPTLDGYEVARQLKRHPALSKIPLVAVTALAMVGDRDRVLAAGFDGYISKPIAPETFVGQVEAFLQPDQRSTRPPAMPSAPTAKPTTPLAQHATILVVDNSFGNINVIRATLEPIGYQIHAAQAVQEALRLARQIRPDLILSDVFIGGESGYDLIRVVQADAQLHAIPVAFISSTSWAEKDMATAIRLGAVTYITRPIEPEALLKVIEACLRGKAK